MAIETEAYDDWLNGKTCLPASEYIDMAAETVGAIDAEEESLVHLAAVTNAIMELRQRGGTFSHYDILVLARMKLP